MSLPLVEFIVHVLDQHVHLVDIRTPREYYKGHIRGAINIDFSRPFEFGEAFDRLNKMLPVYLYCKNGNHCKKATNEIAGFGFGKIHYLEGGIWELK